MAMTEADRKKRAEHDHWLVALTRVLAERSADEAKANEEYDEAERAMSVARDRLTKAKDRRAACARAVASASLGEAVVSFDDKSHGGTARDIVVTLVVNPPAGRPRDERFPAPKGMVVEHARPQGPIPGRAAEDEFPGRGEKHA